MLKRTKLLINDTKYLFNLINEDIFNCDEIKFKDSFLNALKNVYDLDDAEIMCNIGIKVFKKYDKVTNICSKYKDYYEETIDFKNNYSLKKINESEDFNIYITNIFDSAFDVVSNKCNLMIDKASKKLSIKTSKGNLILIDYDENFSIKDENDVKIIEVALKDNGELKFKFNDSKFILLHKKSRDQIYLKEYVDNLDESTNIDFNNNCLAIIGGLAITTSSDMNNRYISYVEVLKEGLLNDDDLALLTLLSVGITILKSNYEELEELEGLVAGAIIYHNIKMN